MRFVKASTFWALLLCHLVVAMAILPALGYGKPVTSNKVEKSRYAGKADSKQQANQAIVKMQAPAPVGGPSLAIAQKPAVLAHLVLASPAAQNSFAFGPAPPPERAQRILFTRIAPAMAP